MSNQYADFVYHPRYGRCPQITGLNPQTVLGGDTYIHWHSPKNCRIPNTAILADLSRQSFSIIPVIHYYDVKRQCRDCGKPFIFFAEEQKYWYEELGFSIHSDCVRCYPCRKRHHGIQYLRVRYEELFHVSERTLEQNLEMADCCLLLIEAGVFHRKQVQRVRVLINRIPAERDEETQSKCNDLLARLSVVENA